MVISILRVYQFQFSGHFQLLICILHCLLDIGCELPKPQIEVGAGMDHVRQKGIEVYTSQFNSTAGLRVNLPVYPAFLEWFNDRGKENSILQCCAQKTHILMCDSRDMHSRIAHSQFFSMYRVLSPRASC